MSINNVNSIQMVGSIFGIKQSIPCIWWGQNMASNNISSMQMAEYEFGIKQYQFYSDVGVRIWHQSTTIPCRQMAQISASDNISSMQMVGSQFGIKHHFHSDGHCQPPTSELIVHLLSNISHPLTGACVTR